MNKLLTKAAKLLLGLSLAAGVGVAVGSQSKASKVDAAEELAFHFRGSSLATGTTYQAWSGSVSSSSTSKVSTATWQITVGNNSAQLGTNAKATNLSKTTLGNGNFSAASGVATALGIATTTQKYAAVYCTTGMSYITKGELIFTGTNGGNITQAWLLSSTNGTSWTIESTKTSSITTGSTFSVTKSSSAKQFAFVCYWNLTNAGGLKGFEYKLYGEYPQTGTITASANSAYSDESVTLTTNATSATWSITSGASYAHLSSTSGKSVDLIGDAAGSVTVKAVASGYTDATKTITFNERPAGTYYDVTFNSNGGSLTPAKETVEENHTFTFPSPGTRSHYTFLGWSSDGGTTKYATGATSPAVTGDTTYTAYWQEDAKYTVTYSAGSNGTGSYSHTNQYGGTYTLLAFANLSGVSASSGYRFKNYTVGGVDKNPGDTFTLSAATTVTVNFEVQPLETTYDFTANFSTYSDGWTNSYGDHTGLRGTTDLGGDYAATIDLYKASKQTSNITTMPVFATKTSAGSWHQVVHFTLNESGYKIKEVEVTFAQWTTKTPDIALFKGNTVAGSPLDSGTIGTKNTISVSNLNGTDFSIGYCDKSTNNVQAGISSISISLEALASFGTLDHITVTGMPNTVYHVGETFDFTGFAVTAYDGSDESTANFKDVTSSVETDLDDPTPFVEGDVPGFDCDVSYSGDGSSDTTSFHVSVYALAEYELVTSEPADWAGQYLIVGFKTVESVTTYYAMNGGLNDPDVDGGHKVVAPDANHVIEAGQELEWTIASYSGGYSIQGKSGKYIGSLTSSSNGMLVSDSALKNTLSISSSDVTISGTNGYHLKLNTDNNGRFRYYSSGSVQLYKLKESSNALTFAETFLASFTCDATGASGPTFTIKEGSTYWSWSLLATEYDTLNAVEKEEFRLGVASESGDEIAQALARYDYVVGKYGTSTYSDFMSRNPAQFGNAKLALASIGESSNTIQVIVIISLISVTAIGGFFFIRKRKVN